MFENSQRPFMQGFWFSDDGVVFGAPPQEKTAKGDWLVVVGEPFSKRFDDTGDLSQWMTLHSLFNMWEEADIVDRMFFLPAVRCYPKWEDGRPKITHNQLNHCSKFLLPDVNQINPQAIISVGWDATRMVAGRGDTMNIAGRVYHWNGYPVIPVWGTDFVSRDKERYREPYKRQWQRVVELAANPEIKSIYSDIDYSLGLDLKTVQDYFTDLDLSYPLMWDLETTSLDNLGIWDDDFDVTCISLYHPDRKESLIIPVEGYPLMGELLEQEGVSMFTWKNSIKEIIRYMRKHVMENPKVRKVGHNLKFDSNAAYKVFGWDVKGFFVDTMLLNYLLNPDQKRLNKLDDLIRNYMPEFADYSMVLEQYFSEHPEINNSYAHLPPDVLFPYAAMDTKLLWTVLQCLEKDIEKRDSREGAAEFAYTPQDGSVARLPTYTLGEYSVYCRSAHFKLALEMEKNGQSIDYGILKPIASAYKRELDTAQDELLQLNSVRGYEDDGHLESYLMGTKSGEKTIKRKERLELKRQKELEENGVVVTEVPKIQLNWNSTAQVADFLFNYCEYPIIEETTKGAAGTGGSVLTKLMTHHQSPEARILLRYREKSKVYDAFLSRLLTDDRKDRLVADDGLLHAQFNIGATGTGRLSSSKPNVQQLPSVVKVVYVSRHNKPKENKFGWLVQRDYSGLEVRILALMSRDERLLEAFRNGEDVHFKTQTFFFGSKADKHNKPQRTICKSALFGNVYGQGDIGLFEQLSAGEVRNPNTGELITLEECKEFNELLYETYPGVRKWIEESHVQGVTSGGVSSAFGFVRPLPALRSYASWVKKKRDRNERDKHSTSSLGKAISGDLRKAQNTPIQSTAADLTVFAACRAMEELAKVVPEALVCNLVHDSIWVDVPDRSMVPIVVRVLNDVMDNVTSWLGEMLPDYDSSWMDAPIIGECELGLNAKDTFVAREEPSIYMPDNRLIVDVDPDVAKNLKLIHADYNSEDGDVPVDFEKHGALLERHLIHKRSSYASAA
jgi:DNA polymerase I-like protein with 3'-5' exonuclease and polymerase domains